LIYRLIVELLLGVWRAAQRLAFAPRLPASWPSCEIQYRYGETLYRITIRQALAADAAMSVLVDGVAQSDRSVLLVPRGVAATGLCRVVIIGSMQTTKMPSMLDEGRRIIGMLLLLLRNFLLLRRVHRLLLVFLGRLMRHDLAPMITS
jgi:hypothetical protein